VGDDHILDFLDVVGFGPFLWLALSTNRVPIKKADGSINGRVAFAGCQEILLHGLQALGYRVSFFELCHYACAALAARSQAGRLGPGLSNTI